MIVVAALSPRPKFLSQNSSSDHCALCMVYKENLPEKPVKPPRHKVNPNGVSGTRNRQSGRYARQSEGGPKRASGRRTATQPAQIRKRKQKEATTRALDKAENDDDDRQLYANSMEFDAALQFQKANPIPPPVSKDVLQLMSRQLMSDVDCEMAAEKMFQDGKANPIPPPLAAATETTAADSPAVLAPVLGAEYEPVVPALATGPAVLAPAPSRSAPSWPQRLVQLVSAGVLCECCLAQNCPFKKWKFTQVTKRGKIGQDGKCHCK